MTTAQKAEEVKHIAETLFAEDPTWVTFYREVLGLHGAVRRNFPTHQAFVEFEQTDTYRDIQHMLRTLRERGPVPSANGEPIHVITVRLPESLHDALREEAHEHRTTLNKLRISKLLQFIDNHVVPGSAGGKRTEFSTGTVLPPPPEQTVSAASGEKKRTRKKEAGEEKGIEADL